MEIRFRPARAEDAAHAVPLIYSAGPEAFEYIFTEGRHTSRDFLHYAFPAGTGMFGYGNHVVAEVNGAVAGIGAFYSGEEYSRLSQALVQQVLGFYRLRSPFVLRRALQTKLWMAPPSRRMLYVANLGVAPEMRSRGVGAALLRQQMQLAREQGKQRFALDVADTNPRAQKLYESLGLRFIRETPFPHRRHGGERVPSARRLELCL